jgi:ABC-type uncharacterized transport system substrate-binding protein
MNPLSKLTIALRGAVSVAHVLVLATAISVAVALPAQAEVTTSDLLIAGRTIGFIEKLANSGMRVGIVYAPESAQSVQQANALRAMLGNQFRVGSLVLTAVMLRTDQVADADVGLFLLSEGAGAAGTKVADASKMKKIPCITFDLSQVRNGACVIGVQSQPRIQILVNKKAAAESGTIFSSVFRLMITEL